MMIGKRLSVDASVDAPASSPDTPFEAAVQAVVNGDLDALRRCLAANPSLAAARSAQEHHATLLHYVMAHGVEPEHQQVPANAADIARLLLGAGAAVDATADFFAGGPATTPLAMLVASAPAAEAGVQAALVDVLCQAGAKVNGLDDDGLPLASAIAFRRMEAAAALVRNGARVDNVVFAAAVGRLDLVQSYVGGTVRPYTDPFGRTLFTPAEVLALAFTTACLAGYASIVEALLAHGVDINVRPFDASTALHEAVRGGHETIALDLLARGADVTVKDQEGFTALHWAAWYGRTPLIAQLLAKGAPLEVTNYYGGTVLDTVVWAAANGRSPAPNALDTIQQLIAAGADVTAVEPYPSGHAAIDAVLRNHRAA